MTRTPLSRLVRAGLLTGVVDGLFACALSAIYNNGDVLRVWQGVAATLLGPEAMQGGTRTAIVGVAMHFGVAFAWSAVFLLAYERAGCCAGWCARGVAC